ncbi:MAG: hypothetical protein ACI4L8_00905 [Candidatus Fimadaptatus sp.]
MRRVVSFHGGDAFERDLVSISGVTTCIERIPAPDQRTMRAWVMQLDRYIDMITPPRYTALAGISDDDGEELHSMRAQAAEMRDEARRADEAREEEELDRLAAEGRRRSGRDEPRAPEATREQLRRSFSRMDTGAPTEQRAARNNEEGSYVRPAARDTRSAMRNSEEDERGAGRPDAAERLTYESTRRAPEGPAPSAPEPPRPRPRPQPRSAESVINSLGLDGALLCAGIADGSFLRYVLERRMIFAAWRRGWINKRTRAYVADASVSQATVAELQLAGVHIDALRTRESGTAAKRAQKIAQADAIFDSAEGLLSDAREGRLDLSGKLLVCDTLRSRQAEELRSLGLWRVAVFTPRPEDTYVSTAELEAMLSFVAESESRSLHVTDWEKLLNDGRLYQEMFALR